MCCGFDYDDEGNYVYMKQPETRTAYVSLETLNHLSFGGKAIVTHIDDDGIAHTERVPDPVVAFGPGLYLGSSERPDLYMPPYIPNMKLGECGQSATESMFFSARQPLLDKIAAMESKAKWDKAIIFFAGAIFGLLVAWGLFELNWMVAQ
jgi:hypothetical protein